MQLSVGYVLIGFHPNFGRCIVHFSKMQFVSLEFLLDYFPMHWFYLNLNSYSLIENSTICKFTKT